MIKAHFKRDGLKTICGKKYPTAYMRVGLWMTDNEKNVSCERCQRILANRRSSDCLSQENKEV